MNFLFVGEEISKFVSHHLRHRPKNAIFLELSISTLECFKQLPPFYLDLKQFFQSFGFEHCFRCYLVAKKLSYNVESVLLTVSL